MCSESKACIATCSQVILSGRKPTSSAGPHSQSAALSSHPSLCTTAPTQYLDSPGRNVMGMVSGQPWPGCQRALQAEQNSMLQALHCTSCGVCSPMSWSWHTAWQVDAGHHVRQGSKSTSSTMRQKAKIRFRIPWAPERVSMENLWGPAQSSQNEGHLGDPARHSPDNLLLCCSSNSRQTSLSFSPLYLMCPGLPQLPS